MKKRIISILLIAVLMLGNLSLASCVIDTDAVPVGAESDESTDISSSQALELPPPPKEKAAIIHMIQPVDILEDWQAGKTEFDADLYVEDMLKVLDKLEWQKSGAEIHISGDFDFRINLYRTAEEVEKFSSFFEKGEQGEADEDQAVFSKDRDVSVQYLINIEENTVNMRLSDYSALSFDIYAEADEATMNILILCLKYYFGPLS